MISYLTIFVLGEYGITNLRRSRGIKVHS